MVLLLLACSGKDAEDPLVSTFPEGFVWGAAGAAHQIEGGNTNNNWYQFETLPAYAGKTAAPSGEAVRGYERYEEDAGLAADLNLGLYRLSIEWSRVEPEKDVWDEAEWDHYRAVLESVVARGMTPMVTLHHFTEPIWTYDLEDPDCAAGPSDTNLCGWTNPEVALQFAEFAHAAGTRFGDLVDEWTTFNEPMTYVIPGYVSGGFPPGKVNLTADAIVDNVLPVVAGMADGHALAYRELHLVDGFDADGDGDPAEVGFTNAMAWIEPLDPLNPEDVAAADRVQALFGYAFPDAVITGLMDDDLDGVPTVSHPEWANTVDQLGYQYYFRFAVKSAPGFPPLDALPCDPVLLEAMGMSPSAIGCPEPDPDNVTQMGYEHYPPGLRLLGEALMERYPGMPLRITENGIATTSGQRRAESIVRHLEELDALLDIGAPVDGYVHWSLTDNFEWAEGFTPKFGLYAVDLATYERSPTLGAEVYARIARDNGIRQSLVEAYGGTGPLSPE